MLRNLLFFSLLLLSPFLSAEDSYITQPGDIYISEIMADSVGLTMLPATEYVEIFNNSDTDISLKGLIFFYLNTQVALPDVVLSSGGYAVLYRAGRSIYVADGALSLGISNFPSALSNNGNNISLKNSNGDVIDETNYPIAVRGKSHERAADGSWYVSTDEKGGTPGAENSPVTPSEPDPDPEDPDPDSPNPNDPDPEPPVSNIQPGDIYISEIMADSAGLTMLPATEYVEIYNNSDADISLDGLFFIYVSNVSNQIALPDVILRSGEYAVLYRAGRSIFVADGALSLGISNFPSAMNNNGNNIGLKSSDGVMIDDTSYPKAIRGKSHERAADGSWYVSTDKKGGTPGAANSPVTPSDPEPDPEDPDDPDPEAPVYNIQPGDIFISEIMSDSASLTMLPATEYVELFNNTDTDISLKGLIFFYLNTQVALPDVVLSSGGYAVLYRAGRSIFVAEGALSLGISNFPSALSNNGNNIGLKNSNGDVIDETNYPIAVRGKSHERAADGSWYVSTDEKGGTPGATNSPVTPFVPDPDPDDPDPDPETPVYNIQPGDIFISEVMSDSAGLTILPATEYVELFNNSDTDISLKGLIFFYLNTQVALPDVVLSSGGYAVLYRAGRSIYVADGALSLGISNFPSALSNNGNNIGLKKSDGVIIDETDYPISVRGKSHERAADGSWYVSTDEKGGTPGAVNSPVSPSEPDPDDSNPDDPIPNPDPPVDNSQPGDVWINEVMANPVGLTALPETEYVEIYNKSGTDISLKGWSFIYDGREFVLPDEFLLSGGYAVLYRSGREISVSSGALSIGFASFPSALNNDGKIVGLKNSKGIVIDEIEYPKATVRQSHERAEDGTWYLSTDEKGGTPGAVNSSKASTDPSPNPDDPDPNPDPYPVADNSRPGDVWINEIMSNPVGLTALPETEYVEIYNKSGADISLKGWLFIYDGRECALPDMSLSSGRYAVLYRSGRDISVSSGALSLGFANFPSALNNDGKIIGLKNSKGVMIDEIAYPKSTAKRAHERDEDGTWYLSTDEKGGTPGAANSSKTSVDPNPNPNPDPNPNPPVVPQSDNSQPGDVLINEVMANPNGLTLLPTTEYVEIVNASGANISLSKWTFVYDGNETLLPDIFLPDEGYAVLYRSGREIVVSSGAQSVGVDKFPSALANTGKTIGLKNSKGIIIDEVTYPNATAGKSYERAYDGSWHLSTDIKGGTPGETNSSKDTINPNPMPDPDPTPDPNPVPDPNPDPSSTEDNSLPGDVLINEIMANPVGLKELPETEYVEIYNASGANISLKDWLFIYDGRETVLPDTVLQDEGYAVLYRSGREISVAPGALSLGLDRFPSALANTKKITGLINSKGVIIDEFEYPNATAAKSYERADDGTWHLSTDSKGGTPGAANSPATSIDPKPTPKPEDPDNPNDPDDPRDPNDPELPGVAIVEPAEVIINEILAEPFVDASEYIELYNNSGRTLSLFGLVIAVRKTDGSISTHYPLNTITELFEHEGYVVLTKEYTGVADFYSEAKSIFEVKLPILNNEGASLVLFRASDGVIIDEVSYSTKWHNASIKTKKGVSLERIDPDGDSQDASNWTSGAAEVGYGTPGYKNSQYINSEALNNKSFVNAPEYISGPDYYILTYQTDKPGYRCRIEVYSANGQKMAEILNNQLITQEGELQWDGKGLNNNRLSPGVYVYYAELYHPDGSYKKVKKAFLVKSFH